MTALKIVGAIVLFALAVLLIWKGPFITAWSLNNLFGLHIPYTLKTWFAIIWLTSIISGYKFSKSA